MLRLDASTIWLLGDTLLERLFETNLQHSHNLLVNVPVFFGLIHIIEQIQIASHQFDFRVCFALEFDCVLADFTLPQLVNKFGITTQIVLAI